MSSKFQGFGNSVIRVSNPIKRRQQNRRRGAVAFGRIRRGPTVKNVDKKVKKVMNMIETKSNISQFNQLNLDAIVTPSSNNWCILNAIQEGTDSDHRNGDKINATSLWWSVVFDGDINQQIPTLVRLIIFYDRQANGALPPAFSNGAGSASLLDLGPSPTLTAVNYPPNQHQKQRYKIIYDNSAMLQPTSTDVAGTAYIPGSVVMRGQVKLNRLTTYSGGTALVANVQSNALYALFMSDGGATTTANAYGTFKFNFKDA